MLDKRIEILKLPIPVLLNNNILNYLQQKGKWDFVFDTKRKNSFNMKQVASPGSFNDAGLARITYSSNGLSGTLNDDYLNNFGDLIYFHCKEKSKKFKIEQITRFYWNLYSRSSKCIWHTDERGINEFVSIIYNLHDNDGGTEFESGFIKSKEGEAIIFPSNLPHKGVGPKEYKWRLNLNIVAHQKFKYE